MAEKNRFFTLLFKIHTATSITVKIIVLTVAVGIVTWAVLDLIQTNKIRSLFQNQMLERLGHQAHRSRLNFDRHVKAHHQSAKLFIKQYYFRQYIKERKWVMGEPINIKTHRRPPPWLPRSSVLRTFAQPRYAILLDAQERAREVYQSRRDSLPPSLLQLSALVRAKSIGQSFITNIENIPHIIASQRYHDSQGQLQATLMLISPIDEWFLISSSGSLTPGSLVALLTQDEDPNILVSSDQTAVAAGTPFSSLQDNYYTIGEEFFDYGSAEHVIKLVSFISVSAVDLLTNSVMSSERRQRSLAAAVFILTFAFIMFTVVYRIQRLTKRISHFSQSELGAHMGGVEFQEGGDQLYTLEKRFHRLTEEVINARDIIKKEAEEHTRLIVNNAFDAILTTDVNGLIITWNPQAEEIFGWTGKDITGKKMSETIIPPQFRRKYENECKTFLTSGESSIFNRQIEAMACHRDGHEFPVELSISPAQSGDNYIFIVTIRDITQRKTVEEKHNKLLAEITKAKIEWEATFDAVSEFIILVDKEFHIKRCNTSFARYCGEPHHALINKEWYQLIIPGDPKSIQHCYELMSSADAVDKLEIMTKDSDWFYISQRPLIDKDGKFLHTVVVATNITHLKNAQKRLKQSEEELKERIEDLENFYDMAVSRELRMKDLKKKILLLEEEISQNKAQDLAFSKNTTSAV
jgi:PAS domain S-box-containing protein